MDYKSCFILMPFTQTSDLSIKELDYIYEHILKKAVEEFEFKGEKYFQVVERFESKVGSIINGIIKNLKSADLVIADLTGLNPNVMYELGVRHTLKRGTIIISQNLQSLPSDLRDYLTVAYTYSRNTTDQVECYKSFRTELHKSISEVITTGKYDSPVLSYLQQHRNFRDEEEIKGLREAAIIYNAIDDGCNKIEALIEFLLENGCKTNEQTHYFQIFNLLLSNINIALNEIKVPIQGGLYKKLLTARTMITEISKAFNMSEYFTHIGSLDHSVIPQFDSFSIVNSLKKRFPNIYMLDDEANKDYSAELITINDFFKREGVLESEVLGELQEYIDITATQLSVENEINQILNI